MTLPISRRLCIATKAALLYNERTVQASAAQLDALERVYATLCAGNLVAWSACVPLALPLLRPLTVRYQV